MAVHLGTGEQLHVEVPALYPLRALGLLPGTHRLTPP